MDFTVRQLRTFWDVAKTGSLTRSSKNLGCSQSSVTTHIQSLESRLGAQLFHRLPHGVRLTPAGETTRDYVARIFSVLDELNSAMKIGGQATGRVVVGSTTLLMEYEMGELVRQCRFRYPEVRISPKVLTATEVESAVAEGEVDVALTLTADPDDEATGLPGVSRQSLFRVPMVPVGEPQPNGTTTPPSTDSIERVLVVDPDCASQEALVHHLRREHGIDPAVMETGSTRGALSMAQAGLGVAMVPESAVSGAGLAGQGLSVLPWLPRAETYAQALWSAGARLSPAVSAFLDLVRQAPGATARQAVLL
ncbi:LysR family transcriptional regulator [Kitasatospora albolonga]|uniref:LysR family transcriptional regulator n=1 Tax=Kitasatospora albolonga TaxID=68173 RepID=UPI0031EA96A2